MDSADAKNVPMETIDINASTDDKTNPADPTPVNADPWSCAIFPGIRLTAATATATSAVKQPPAGAPKQLTMPSSGPNNNVRNRQHGTTIQQQQKRRRERDDIEYYSDENTFNCCFRAANACFELLSGLVRPMMRILSSYWFYWILSVVAFVFGWWVWIYGLVWTGYYQIENVSPLTTTNPATALTSLRPYVIRQHFPMRLYHAIPGFLISLAFVFLCIPDRSHSEMHGSIFDDEAPPCDARKVRVVGMVFFGISGYMICLLWMILMFSFGDVDLRGSNSFDQALGRDQFTEDNALLVTAAALIVQCTVLEISLASAVLSGWIRKREARAREGYMMGAFV